MRRVRPILERPDARVLDICCGTGDLVMALQRACPRPVFGSDFCHPMLVGAREKVARQHAPSLLFESDALRLPVRDASLDLITVAFGFRNLANYEDGLREMRRVLRPGGMAAILEFSQPPNAALRSAVRLLFAPRAALDRRPAHRQPRRLHLPARIHPQISHRPDWPTICAAPVSST